MDKNTVRLKISAIGTRGEGIAYGDGFTCFVPFCLPGEEVLALITKKKGGVAYAEAKKILRSVNGRIKPECAVYGKCGGCNLQHMSYDGQLDFKKNLVAGNLKKIGGVVCDVKDTVPCASPYRYRNKLQVPFGNVGGKTVTGFYAEGTHDIVPTSSCPLQDVWADDLCRAAREFADRYGISAYDWKSGKGLLRHLVARYVCGQLLVAVVINGDLLPYADRFAEALSERFDKFGLFVNINKKPTNVIMGDVTKHVRGIKRIDGETCGVSFCLQPESFFQVNDDVREKLYGQAAALVREDGCEVIIDAFSGVGVLSGVLAKGGAEVYGIEIVPQAVADADDLKRRNGLDNLTNICGDVNKELITLCRRLKGKKIAMVLDPPRKGLGKETKEAIAEAAPDRIVYISCDSATLARDIKDLSDIYSPVYCRPFDMFPQTAAVETVVLLAKK